MIKKARTRLKPLYGVEETIADKDFKSQTKPTLIIKM
jgi:hypothetical protein